MSDTRAPQAHELELSLFGKGYGECAVLHLGSNHWLVVDSLKNADGNPIALVYLSEIGVNAAEAVSTIIATHWHDDHVSGLSDIYAQCPNARLALPAAMGRDEWRAFRQAVAGGGTERFSSGVAELEKLALLRAELNRQSFVRGTAHRILLRMQEGSLAHGLPVEVELLSPSDQDIEAFCTRLATAPELEPPTRTQSFSRNDVSVVAWISVGAHRILLGADLEVTGDRDTGWDAVINSPSAPVGRAALFKVAHHGSINGHHPRIWEERLSTEPQVALAPFSRAPGLPRPSDVERITQLTPHAFTTGRAGRRAKRRDTAVERTIRDNSFSITSIADVGHVRFRLDPRDEAASWAVQLRNGASALAA